ncbi:protein of unknown function [Blastococcus saxobsidens DD2]|uniref:Uncharacterized protein n=1 Tax=Blastococcus saxobsidens (strain DD2) TaxID=1146883 RepID=H6RM72_BLASD|nr:protein of unknown function [Blastococcus saxobsidens DD2]
MQLPYVSEDGRRYRHGGCLIGLASAERAARRGRQRAGRSDENTATGTDAGKTPLSVTPTRRSVRRHVRAGARPER